MRFKALVPIPDEEYMLKEVQVELTDEQILAIGDRYAELKRERIFKNKDCKDCKFYEDDGVHSNCSRDCCDKDHWMYGGIKNETDN